MYLGCRITMTQNNFNLKSRTVRIANTNYERLASLGKFGETVNSVLSKILEQNEKSKKW